jgi:signal transduction histidine kinase
MAVNVSAKQLADPDLLGHVRSALGQAGLPPSNLCLEITETVLMDDIEASIAVLQSLRDLGVRVAVDDFGIGYSSLNYLRRLPVDIVKVDRAFTAELGDPAANAIVAAIANLSHALGLEVIAEGVETRQQVVTLQALRCDQAQGYLLGWPMTIDEIPTWSPTAWKSEIAEEIDVVALVGRRVEVARGRSGRHLSFQAPQSSVLVPCEPDAIVTVLDELVANAIAYSEPDTPVTVRVSSDRRWVRVSVSDWGIGMTKSDAERCFEQFFQGERGPVSGRRGTGIGLYIVRSLIESIGGFTAVKSSPKGHTTITFALPRQRRTPGAGVGERSSIQEFMKQVGVQPRSSS